MRWLGAILVAGLFAPASPAADPPWSVLLLVADDWGYQHAGVLGDPAARTPHFDAVARDGMVFTHAFCASPSCSPSRAGFLTGQHIHRLAEGGNLWGVLPARFEVLPDRLEKAGYAVGLTGKGWGPGNVPDAGRPRNPAGPQVRSFEQFLAGLPADKPFCFWLGSKYPHRPYAEGSGAKAGFDASKVRLPAFWPDSPAVRNDVTDYLAAVEAFDTQVGQALAALAKAGRADRTIVVVTSDNGWSFPRCKANLYDGGTRVPLAIRWPGRVTPGGRTDALVSQTDLAPTLLAALGQPPLPDATGRSLLPLLDGQPPPPAFREVFTERERHANVRAGDAGYPARALRTPEWLYVANLRPDRWPAGDPQLHHSVGPFGDCDDGPAKRFILTTRGPHFNLCFGKRPAEELYDVRRDPDQVHNLAAAPAHAATLATLRQRLTQWRRDTGDPRVTNDDDRWDKYRYYGEAARGK